MRIPTAPTGYASVGHAAANAAGREQVYIPLKIAQQTK